MLATLVSSFLHLFSPTLLLYLVAGSLFGLIMGFIPGIGGIFTLVMLLSFVFFVPPEAGIVLLLSAHALVETSGSITGILFGVPGSPTNAATVLDGYPMAQKGQAGRAIGAAVSASALGGIFGAIILLLFIPIMRPVVMSFGPAEILFLSLLGVATISVLSAGNPLKGVVVGLIGVLLSLVGQDWVTGAMRYTYGLEYLWDGFHILPVFLGLFAVSEMISLSISGGEISKVSAARIEDSPIKGLIDTLKHWWLVVRCAVIGVLTGFIPGLGGVTAGFLSYGYAAVTMGKSKEKMGTGEVVGVIGPESANNAKEGGGLIPTIAFGIPGTPGMVILIGALTVMGITPGVDMLGPKIDTVFLMVAILVVSNIVGAAMIFPVIKYLAIFTRINVRILAPIILVITTIAAFNSARSLGDIITLAVFGVLGYEMKKLGYSRPALSIGFILGVGIERNMWLAYNVYGFGMFQRPTVFIGLIILAVIVLIPFIKKRLPNLTERWRGNG